MYPDLNSIYRRPPLAPTSIKGRSDDGVWQLAVQCPYCPAEHRHGGGNGDQPSIAGTRAPHCQDVHYRNRLMFDARVTRYLPHYELAPAESRSEWDGEREYASFLLEEAEMAIEEDDEKAARQGTAAGRIVNQQIREMHGLVEEIEEGSRTGRNSAFLAAWKAKQEGGQ
ncbi:hypothetical protein [Kitasatospora sp. NBC_01266]|uniref:hypothetical protein n=1 Tax=Kitasatospora sp. NBC_01266 TaxID=2903572 RepID=UPI002E32D2D6|nr:hypothetical protein [Kitasatospora sp. NBC_01266]